jgi:hypothetical protein
LSVSSLSVPKNQGMQLLVRMLFKKLPCGPRPPQPLRPRPYLSYPGSQRRKTSTFGLFICATRRRNNRPACLLSSNTYGQHTVSPSKTNQCNTASSLGLRRLTVSGRHRPHVSSNISSSKKCFFRICYATYNKTTSRSVLCLHFSLPYSPAFTR